MSLLGPVANAFCLATSEVAQLRERPHIGEYCRRLTPLPSKHAVVKVDEEHALALRQRHKLRHRPEIAVLWILNGHESALIQQPVGLLRRE